MANTLAPGIPLPVNAAQAPAAPPRCPDLTPAQWAAIRPLIEEAWALRMTSAGVAAVLEASQPWPA